VGGEVFSFKWQVFSGFADICDQARVKKEKQIPSPQAAQERVPRLGMTSVGQDAKKEGAT